MSYLWGNLLRDMRKSLTSGVLDLPDDLGTYLIVNVVLHAL